MHRADQHDTKRDSAKHNVVGNSSVVELFCAVTDGLNGHCMRLRLLSHNLCSLDFDWLERHDDRGLSPVPRMILAPTHGATSVPSLAAILWLSILLARHANNTWQHIARRGKGGVLLTFTRLLNRQALNLTKKNKNRLLI